MQLLGCSSNKEENEGGKQAVYQEGELEDIQITTSGQHVQLVHSEGNQVKIRMSSGELPPVELDGEKLTVSVKASKKVLNFSTPTIVIEVPDKPLASIELNTTTLRMYWAVKVSRRDWLAEMRKR